jgi:hypothetical protein
MTSVFSKALIHLSRLIQHLRVQKAGLDMLTPRTENEIVCANRETTAVWRTTSMNTSRVLWTSWHEQPKEVLTGIHGHQKKTLALFVLGIVLSGSAVMQRVAETLNEHGISEAKMSSSCTSC